MEMNKFLQYNKSILLKWIFVTLFVSSGWMVSASAPVPTHFEKQAKVVKCYPNPAISYINFEFPTSIVSKSFTIELFSFTGKNVYTTSINASKIVITLNNDFYRGVYIYQVKDKAGKIVETGKFQVVR